MHNLTASIVLYNNSPIIVRQAIVSFLNSVPSAKLYLVDNSPNDQLRELAKSDRVEYLFNKKNIGFGAAHNIVLSKIIKSSKYHLILNPDVYFDSSVVKSLYEFMEGHPDVGHVMPKVRYPNNDLQFLCKLLPHPRTLLIRRFLNFINPLAEWENHRYELKFTDYNQILNVPFLSGCFMFLRVEALNKVGFFDERFFLYTEDADLTRRIHKYYKTIFYPHHTIYHHHERGSYKNSWLMWCNIVSAVKYFNKWGWFFDADRDRINNAILESYCELTLQTEPKPISVQVDD